LWTGYDYLRSGLLHANALDDQTAQASKADGNPENAG